MNKTNSLFAANIRFLRKVKMKMTQAEFGELLGATRGQIVSYEIQESRPKGQIESELLRKFKITRQQLYDSKLTATTKAPPHPDDLEKRIARLEVQINLIVEILSNKLGKK